MQQKEQNEAGLLCTLSSTKRNNKINIFAKQEEKNVEGGRMAQRRIERAIYWTWWL
jgi:hypothetical protein